MQEKKRISNNNQQVIHMLARESSRMNRGRNRILAATAAFGMIVLCTVFSVALGRVDAEYIQAARGNGTIASTYLERGTKEQYETVRKLDYVKAAGRSKTAGEAYLPLEEGKTFFCAMETLDETAWRTLTVPAYTDIHGRYPEEPGELMLPVRALFSAGIENPSEGMKFRLTVQTAREETVEKEFSLCGWYTDYLDPSVSVPVGYVSESQLREWDMDMEHPDSILILQKDGLDEYTIEERLYEDVPTMDAAQQFIGGNTHMYSVVNDMAGGYRMAGFCAGLILLSVFLFIQNVLGISLYKDIRQIGLLNIIGATKSQLQGIYFRQNGKQILKGLAAGSIGAGVMILYVVPGLLGNLYLYNFGKSKELLVFRPGLFLAAAVFVAMVTGLSAFFTVRKAVSLSPVEAVHYIGEKEKIQKESLQKKQGRKWAGQRSAAWEVRHMAWKNLFRRRKQSALTILSLFLGLTAALGSVVLSVGTDYTNAINRRPDFVILAEPFNRDVAGEGYDGSFSPITHELMNEVMALQGIKEEECVLQRGAYMLVNRGEPALYALSEAEGWREDVLADITVQVVPDEYIQELQEFSRKNNLSVNIDVLKNGTGAVLLHEHQLSPALERKADQTVGEKITLGQAVMENGEARIDHAIQVEFGGYIDVRAKGFPALRRTWHGPGILYLLVSEEGFKRLGVEEKVFGADLAVRKKWEPETKIRLEKLLQDQNREDPRRRIFLQSKSEELKSAQGYIRTNRVVMGALSAVLLLMGALNYFNVIATGLVSRRKELAVLESIGMTQRQVLSMLIAEGVHYYILTMGLLVTAGTGILKGIEWYMNKKIAYFRYVYPMQEMLLVLLLLLVFCVGVPWVMYRYHVKTSLTERIALEAE